MLHPGENNERKTVAKLEKRPESFEVSSDGRYVYFSHRGGSDLFRVDVRGATVTKIVDRGKAKIACHRPRLSPDGKRPTFVGEAADGSQDIYLVEADGSDLKNLTSRPAKYYDLIWLQAKED